MHGGPVLTALATECGTRKISCSRRGWASPVAVKKKLTSDTQIKGQKIRASEDDPRYLVESEKSGGQAAHKAEALTKKKGG